MAAWDAEIEGSTLIQNGRRVFLGRETSVTPAWAVLPMVCSWSLYFAQSVTEAITSRALALHSLCPLHDKSGGLSLGPRKGIQTYYVYVDNLGVIAKTQQEAGTVLRQCKTLFAENGITRHKSELGQKVKSLTWTAYLSAAQSVVGDLGLFDEPWTRSCDAGKCRAAP